MNELETALLVRRALDKSAERLPYKAVHRLELARKLALSRMDGAAPESAPVAVNVLGDSLSLAGGPRRFAWLGPVAGAIAPLLLVVACLFGASNWSDQQRAEEVAEVDAAMLTDDLPIALYADRGFGVFIKNSSQP